MENESVDRRRTRIQRKALENLLFYNGDNRNYTVWL